MRLGRGTHLATVGGWTEAFGLIASHLVKVSQRPLSDNVGAISPGEPGCRKRCRLFEARDERSDDVDGHLHTGKFNKILRG